MNNPHFEDLYRKDRKEINSFILDSFGKNLKLLLTSYPEVEFIKVPLKKRKIIIGRILGKKFTIKKKLEKENFVKLFVLKGSVIIFRQNEQSLTQVSGIIERIIRGRKGLVSKWE
jgi:hypothetical protein